MSGSGQRLSFATIFIFSLGTLPVSALGVVLFVYLPSHLASHLGVSLGVISSAWAWVRFIDLVVDPALGHIMDRTTTTYGRYRIWLAGGVPVIALGTYMLFMAPVGIGGWYLFFWLFVLYFGNSILAIAQAAWSATLAVDYHERSRVFGVTAATGVIAAVGTLLIPIFGPRAGLSDARSVQLMGLAIVAMAPLGVWLAAWRTPEKVNRDTVHHFSAADYREIFSKPEVLRLFFAQMALVMGPGWMSAMYLFYFQDVRGYTQPQATVLLLVYILIGVAGALLTAYAAKHFGKHRTLIATTAAYSAALLLVPLIPKGNVWAGVPLMAWCGFMAAGFGLMINAMMADVGDEIRLRQGKERISLLYAVLSIASKLSAAGAILLSFALLDAFGYHAQEGAHNTPEAIRALEYVFILGPIFFVMFGGICVWGWRLDEKRHAGIRAELDARDALLIEAQALADVGAPPDLSVLAAEGESS